jgi:hypothetical protein
MNGEKIVKSIMSPVVSGREPSYFVSDKYPLFQRYKEISFEKMRMEHNK